MNQLFFSPLTNQNHTVQPTPRISCSSLLWLIKITLFSPHHESADSWCGLNHVIFISQRREEQLILVVGWTVWFGLVRGEKNSWFMVWAEQCDFDWSEERRTADSWCGLNSVIWIGQRKEEQLILGVGISLSYITWSVSKEMHRMMVNSCVVSLATS